MLCCFKPHQSNSYKNIKLGVGTVVKSNNYGAGISGGQDSNPSANHRAISFTVSERHNNEAMPAWMSPGFTMSASAVGEPEHSDEK